MKQIYSMHARLIMYVNGRPLRAGRLVGYAPKSLTQRAGGFLGDPVGISNRKSPGF